MGKKRQRVSNKHVYQKPSAKYYVKKSTKKLTLGENAAKVAAVASYPFYFVASKVNTLIKNAKSNSQKGSNTSQTRSRLKLNIDHKKLEQLTSMTKEVFEKGWKFIKPYKYYVAGATAIIAVAVIGYSVVSGMEPKDQQTAEMTPQHIVSIPKTATLDAASEESTAVTAEEQTVVETPQIKVLEFAAVKAYQLKVNGDVVANFKTEEEANQLLEQLKAKYTPTDGAQIKDIYFSEEVVIEEGQVNVVEFEAYDTVESALEFIVKGTKEEKKHVVQKGENYWVIAQYYGISPYDLELANPDIKAETIQIGQEISLVVPTPIISVCTVEEASYTDSIAFEVQYEETSSLYKGESRTKVNGVYGERAVVAEVIKENGREIGRTILSENIVAEPQSKVVYKGTKDPPPKMGTGTLIHPTSRGPITSEFGAWRWGRSHTGIDIGLNTGSNVKAADGGVVTEAGYDAVYGKGYYIVVNHGGNITTLYAHNSKNYVSRGEKVYQGQVIAASGNTGVSTGPHLHFEVRVNGVPKNPRNYINF